MNSLTEIEKSLNAAVGGNQTVFSLINTRLVLRAGVNLKTITPGEDRNPTAISKTLDVLAALGYPRDALMRAR